MKSLKFILEWAGARYWSPGYLFTFQDLGKIVPRASENRPVTNDVQGYHEEKKVERESLFLCIREFYSSRPLKFCSIGAGFAGEESTLINHDSWNLTLIESDKYAGEFLGSIYPDATKIIIKAYQDIKEKLGLYDIVYVAGLGSWMNSDPFAGVEKELLDFAQTNLSDDGMCICLLNGGLHSEAVLNSQLFLQAIDDSLTQKKMKIYLYASHKDKCSILIFGKMNPNPQSKLIERIKVDFCKTVYKDVDGKCVPLKKQNLIKWILAMIVCESYVLSKEIFLIFRAHLTIVLRNIEIFRHRK